MTDEIARELIPYLILAIVLIWCLIMKEGRVK